MANNQSYRQNHPPTLVWTCPLTRTGKRSAHSTCAKEFAKEMGFQLIETSDDGNCFFYTLAKFAKRSGYAPLLLEENERRNAQALRQRLVDHMEANLALYAPFLANNNQESIHEQVNELRQNGTWALEAGDLVPMAGANAFGIHINMYNILDQGDRDVVQLVPLRSQEPSSVYVSIMRVHEGHFQLLWPRSGEFQASVSSSSLRPSSRPNAPVEVIAAAHAAVQAAQIAVQAAKKVSPSSSLQSNEEKLNHIIRNLNQLSLGPSTPSKNTTGLRRSTRSTRSKTSPVPVSSRKRANRSTRKNQSYANNNNELRRALEESLLYQ
jgi:hypothetical protein